MNTRLIIAGKPALAYAKTGVDEYLKRLSRFNPYEVIVVKAGNPHEVSNRLLEKSTGCFRIILDERGLALTTRQFAQRLDAIALRGDIKSIAFLIGAADGHTQALRDQADLLLSLSSFTLQHELALVILLEQLYRVESLRSNSPYHRD